VFVPQRAMVAELWRSMLRHYKGIWVRRREENKAGTACRAPTGERKCANAKRLGAEEDGFALEGFDGDEDGGGGVDAGGGEDYGDGTPVVGAGDDFFAD
jgi:hypothetical protein